MQQPRIAINLEGRRFVAVMADVAAHRPRIESYVDATLPDGVTAADAPGVGLWMRSILREAGMYGPAKRSGVVFPVARGEVVLKRLSPPPGTRAEELPELIRLQMLRQATVAGDELTIDYAQIEPPGGRGSAGELTYLAGAVSTQRLDWRRAVCRAAKVRLARSPLAPAGHAALFRPSALRIGGSTIGVALGQEETEFVVLEEGVLAFARVVPGLGMGSDDVQDRDRMAARVGVEAKRTWMAHQVGPQALPIETVCVLGQDALASAIAAECGRVLEVPASTLGVDFDFAAGRPAEAATLAVIAPLVGSLMEHAAPQPGIDFAHPRRAADRRAIARKRALVAAFVALLVGGGLFTTARLDLARRQQRLDGLKERWAQQSRDYTDYVRQRARVQHLERWRSDKLDWVAQLQDLLDDLPDPAQLRLDGLVMNADTQVIYDRPRGENAYSDKYWKSRTLGTISISGTMASRETADGLRKRLIADQQYEVESIGPDLPNRFEFRLHASGVSKATPPAKSGGGGAGGGGGGARQKGHGGGG